MERKKYCGDGIVTRKHFFQSSLHFPSNYPRFFVVVVLLPVVWVCIEAAITLLMYSLKYGHLHDCTQFFLGELMTVIVIIEAVISLMANMGNRLMVPTLPLILMMAVRLVTRK